MGREGEFDPDAKASTPGRGRGRTFPIPSEEAIDETNDDELDIESIEGIGKRKPGAE